MGRHSAISRTRPTGLLPLTAAAALMALAYVANLWITPRILHLTCDLSTCAPRAIALVAWSLIAAVPAAAALIAKSRHTADGPRWWLTLTSAAVLASPGIWLIIGRRGSPLKWASLTAEPGFPTFQAAAHTTITFTLTGVMAFSLCALLSLITQPSHTPAQPARTPARPSRASRRLARAGPILLALSLAAALITLLINPPA